MTDLILDTVVWWFGAVLLASVGYAGAVAAIAYLIALATAYAQYYMSRGENLARNLEGLRAWDKPGRPVWTDDGNGYVMKPTKAVKGRDGH